MTVRRYDFSISGIAGFDREPFGNRSAPRRDNTEIAGFGACQALAAEHHHALRCERLLQFLCRPDCGRRFGHRVLTVQYDRNAPARSLPRAQGRCHHAANKSPSIHCRLVQVQPITSLCAFSFTMWTRKYAPPHIYKVGLWSAIDPEAWTRTAPRRPISRIGESAAIERQAS